MRLAVVGTGLIGASAGLAARRAGIEQVAGWDEDPAPLKVAAERGAVEPAGSLAEAIRDADVALVAVPVAALPAVVHDVLESAPAGSTVTDVGSTKGPFVLRPVTTRASWAAIRSAGPRRAGPGAQARICSRAPPGS